MKDLNIYRTLAISYLKKNASNLTQPLDITLDAALRTVSALPPKPPLDATYNNVVGIKPVLEQRLLCLSLLLARLTKHFEELHSIDYSLDSISRVIGNLPPLPLHNSPYLSLFTLPPLLPVSIYNPVSTYSIQLPGLKLMHFFEGLSLKAYKDPGSFDGLPITIGYGTTRINGAPVKLGSIITTQQADLYFKADLAQFESALKLYVSVPITQGMFDALTSLIYNIGVANFVRSTLLKELNNKNYSVAADCFLMWTKGGNNKILQGLVNRRKAEIKLFLI